MIQHALKAQARGLHIFPVAAGDKVPHRLAGYTDGAGNFHGWGETATNDVGMITQFWTQVDPQANIGVACKPSELLVIDLDVAKADWNLKDTEWAYLHDAYGPRVNGEDLWDEMQYKLGGGHPSGEMFTYSVRTGSGGTHLYFQWPAYWGPTSQASPVKGVVDVRGNGGQWGGYVLAEGSVTAAGPYYELWTGCPPQAAPEWVRKLVTPRPTVKRSQAPRSPGLFAWGGLAHTVRTAGEGNRNNALLWAARSMYSDGASEQEAKDSLGPAAQEAGLGWFEIERTIESAYRVQRQKEG
jgi:hypothetical protein